MRRPVSITLLFSTLLSGCSFGFGGSSSGSGAVVLPKASVYMAENMLHGSDEIGKDELPAALLGLYVAEYLAGAWRPDVNGAMESVKTALSILRNDQETTDPAYALLEQLLAIMQADIRDQISRSTDRAATLDAYAKTLSDTNIQATAELQAVIQRIKSAEADRNAVRTNVNTLQRDINAAVKKQDYATAAAKQSEITNKQAELARLESVVKQLNTTKKLFQDLTKAARERLDAIAANRDALIAGVQVVDMPGADDLGILKNTSSRRSGGSNNAFGL